MNIKKLIALTAVIACYNTASFAQCNTKETLKADDAYLTNSFSAAIELYGKASGKVKGKEGKETKACIAYMIAKCYMKINDYKKAESQFKKVMKTEPYDAEAYYEYGQLLKSLGRYEEAKTQFDKYVEKNPTESKGQVASKSCEDAILWKQNPTCYQVENLKAFNTKDWDFSPIISNKKGTQLIFTSNRAKSLGKDNPIWDAPNEDFWMSNEDKNGKWSAPVPVPTIGTIYSDGTGTMDKKFTTIYFTRCFGDKKMGSGCQIYKSRRQGPQKWTDAEKLELAPSDTFVTGHPTISNDGKFMIFTSNMPGGEGGMDLWVAGYDRKAKDFANPVNLGKEVNTPYNEMFPHLKTDGTLYFSSNDPKGMGGFDIYKAKNTGDYKFAEIENMRFPINSEKDDIGIVFEAGKEAGYLSSNRTGGKGNDDIYSFNIPQAKILLSGTVRDKDTKAVIVGAKVELVDAQGNKFEATTDATGFYKKEIPFGTAYDMTASKLDYYNDVNRASSMGMDPLKTCRDTNLVADFYLKTQNVPLEYEVRFELAKAVWYPEWTDTLKKIVTILTDNPTMVVEMGAHTDAQGDGKSNQDLSDRRAAAVVKYLVDQDIDPKRLVAKGYGEEQPRTLQNDVVGSRSKFLFPKGTLLNEDYIAELKKTQDSKVVEDAHELNRRVTLKKVSNDYKPPVVKEETEEEGSN